MTKWIDTKEATLIILKYDLDKAQQYQLYLDKDQNSMVEYGEYEEEIHGPMEFEQWLEEFEDAIDGEEFIKDMLKIEKH